MRPAGAGLALAVVLLLQAEQAAGLGRTLGDCQEVAAAFRNTCDVTLGPVASVAGHGGDAVTCTGNGACAGVTNADGSCTWQRKLCVTCAEVGGVVRIRVQSNGLPESCYSSPVQPVAQDNDFEVDFNPPAVQRVTPQTQEEVNAQVCNIRAHSQVPADSHFVLHGRSNLRVVAGLALDGVAYMNQMSALGVDPFYPSVYGDVTDPAAAVEKVDMCLGHPQGAGIYHYHTPSPCVAAPGSQPVAPCNARNGCRDFAAQSVSTYPRELMVVGIAKDGHVIYGPYLANGEEAAQAGLDVCNGAVGLAECDDTYAYFATKTFPYLVGCFGAGGRPAFTPQCTTNGPSAYTQPQSACSATRAPAVPATPTPPTPLPATPLPPPPPTTSVPTTAAPATSEPETMPEPAAGTCHRSMHFGFDHSRDARGWHVMLSKRHVFQGAGALQLLKTHAVSKFSMGYGMQPAVFSVRASVYSSNAQLAIELKSRSGALVYLTYAAHARLFHVTSTGGDEWGEWLSTAAHSVQSRKWQHVSVAFDWKQRSFRVALDGISVGGWQALPEGMCDVREVRLHAVMSAPVFVDEMRVLCAAPATAAPTPAPTQAPLNLMIFMPDDFAFVWEEAPPGTRSELPAALPHMARVREEGAVFQRAYTTAPKCAPSRFSLLTGRYASRSSFARALAQRRNSDNATWDGRVHVEVPTTKITEADTQENLQTALARRGYETIHSGKWHLFPTNSDEEYLANYSKLTQDVAATGFTTVASAYVSNMRRNGADGTGHTWSHNPEWLVNTSLAAVSAAVNAGKPFFLHMTPTGPHNPRTQPAMFDFDPRATPAGMLPDAPATTMPARADVWQAAGELGTPEEQDLVAGHMWVDAALGAVLEGLEALQVLDNTVVVLCMDHGVAGKSTVAEAGTRIMQAVRYPAEVQAGARIPSVVVNADTTAALLDYAGADAGYTLDGESWRAEAAGGVRASTLPKAMEMMTDRALIVWPYKIVVTEGSAGTPALYDLSGDGEDVDLAGEDAHASDLLRMLELLQCHDASTSARPGTGGNCSLPHVPNPLYVPTA